MILDTWQLRADQLGLVVLRLFVQASRLFASMFRLLLLFVRMHWLSRPAVINVLIRQLYFTGVESLPWVILMALAAGVLAVYNIVAFALSVQDMSLIGSLIRGLLVQELAPVLVTVFLLARSGVAVAAEIGTMHIRGEDMSLRLMGISIEEYLYLPRLIAFALCGLILTFIFMVISVWVGGLAVSWTHMMNFSQYLIEFRRGVDFSVVALMMSKAVIYPLLTCLMLLEQGCQVGRDPNQIPRRATYGVLGSLMMMVLLDGLIAIGRNVL